MAAGSPIGFTASSLSTNTFDHFFNEFVLPGMEKGFVSNSKLYDRFKTNTESCLGKYGIIKVNTISAASFGPSGTTAYPTALHPAYDEFKFFMKRIYGKLDFDGLSVACSQGKGAIKELVKNETESMLEFIPRKMNKLYWGDGSGRLACIASGTGTTSLVVDGGSTGWGLFGIDSNGYSNPSQYLFLNQRIISYTTGPAAEITDNTITGISAGGAGSDTLTVTSGTWADGSLIMDYNTYVTADAAGTGVPMGLAGIVDTANQTCGVTSTSLWQGVERSANTWAQGQVFNMGSSLTSPTVVTEEKILQVLQSAEKWGTTKVILTNPFIWRALFGILKADKTMPNDPGLWGGLTGIKFYGGKSNAVPIIYDEDCPDGRMYFLDDSTIKISAPVKNGLTFEPGANGHILTKREDYDEYTANLKFYYNMTCNKPQANALLRYVKHASA